MFVENLTYSDYNEEKELLLKSKTTTTFADGGCTLQKWHSNYSNLAKPSSHENHDSLSIYSMEQLGANNVIMTQKSMVFFGTSEITLLVYILRNAWSKIKR